MSGQTGAPSALGPPTGPSRAGLVPGDTAAVSARSAHPDDAVRQGPLAVAADLVAISKPRIILLLLVVAWASLFVAAQGIPDLTVFLAVTAAGVMSTAASGALNHVLERDRDRRMGRTAARPVASGRLSPGVASTYGMLLGIGAFAVLWLPGHRLAAALVLGAMVFYVVGYTLLLKPRTAQNIVIGGISGGFPALIAWAATGTLGAAAWPAWVLAGIVVLWTPPHFWALALLYQEDYRAADYPMLPVVRGEATTKRHMLAYAVLTAVASLLLVPVAGLLYLAAAVVLGALFVQRFAALLRTQDRLAYRAAFLFSIQYLGLLLLALMADQAFGSVLPAATLS